MAAWRMWKSVLLWCILLYVLITNLSKFVQMPIHSNYSKISSKQMCYVFAYFRCTISRHYYVKHIQAMIGNHDSTTKLPKIYSTNGARWKKTLRNSTVYAGGQRACTQPNSRVRLHIEEAIRRIRMIICVLVVETCFGFSRTSMRKLAGICRISDILLSHWHKCVEISEK